MQVVHHEIIISMFQIIDILYLFLFILFIRDCPTQLLYVKKRETDSYHLAATASVVVVPVTFWLVAVLFGAVFVSFRTML